MSGLVTRDRDGERLGTRAVAMIDEDVGIGGAWAWGLRLESRFAVRKLRSRWAPFSLIQIPRAVRCAMRASCWPEASVRRGLVLL